MRHILLANRYDDVSWNILKQFVPENFSIAQLEEVSKSSLMDSVSGADYLIASGRLRIDEEVLNQALVLKMVSRTGVGLDSIDQRALAIRGIPLYVNSGINAQSVAEHTLLLMLAALRKLPLVDSSTKAGQWLKRPLGVQTHELAGKKVFVAGLGNVGRKVIQLLSPFGCIVDGIDFIEKGKLPAGVFDSDIVTFHCPLLPSTHHVLDADTIARLKPGCIVVNTARGGLIDEKALAAGLRDGQVGFACLDVREDEPAHSTEPFDCLDNVILSSHIAGVTYESFASMMQGAVSNIVAFENGRLDEIESCKVSTI